MIYKIITLIFISLNKNLAFQIERVIAVDRHERETFSFHPRFRIFLNFLKCHLPSLAFTPVLNKYIPDEIARECSIQRLWRDPRKRSAGTRPP